MVAVVSSRREDFERRKTNDVGGFGVARPTAWVQANAITEIAYRTKSTFAMRHICDTFSTRKYFQPTFESQNCHQQATYLRHHGSQMFVSCRVNVLQMSIKSQECVATFAT